MGNTLVQSFSNTHPNFFSNLKIFLSIENFKSIKDIINQVEVELTKNIDFRKEPSGVFMSYDFHITNESPKLIEINTNAGGAVLFQMYLESVDTKNIISDFKLNVVKMFEKEWNKSGKQRDLKTIVILDSNPEMQAFYTEFLLIQDILQNVGYKVFILDPKDLNLENNCLIYNNTIIDLIYNRHTDFYLLSDEMKNIKTAYEGNCIVLTPNPRVYDTFANKKHLIRLSQKEELRDFVPETFLLSNVDKEKFWHKRKQYFFKPLTGYGSKGVYCGKKITTKVWEEIFNSEYLAQKCTQPNKVKVMVNNVEVEMKYDIRFVTYEGKITYVFARAYSGQATNMKTEGGGFAKVALSSAP